MTASRKARRVETLLTRISAMQYGDTGSQVTADLRGVFTPHPVYGMPASVAFSEVRLAVRLAVRAACKQHGYRLFLPTEGGDCIAVAPFCLVTREHYEHVLDAQTGLPKGNYTARGVVSVDYVTPKGNVIGESYQHYLTAYQLDTKPGPENRREDRYAAQITAHIDALTAAGEGYGPVAVPPDIASFINRAKVQPGWGLTFNQRERTWYAGRGGHIALGKADTNVDERDDTGFDPDAIQARFSAAGIQSVYDRVEGDKDLIGTHGPPRSGVIDVGYLRDQDRRVDVVDIENHGRRFSDHNLIDIALAIRLGAAS